MFLIDIENPKSFSREALCKFLDGTPTSATHEIVDNWQPVNTLKYQNEKDGSVYDMNTKTEHPHIGTLREDHFWIEEAERRYQKIIEECNSRT